MKGALLGPPETQTASNRPYRLNALGAALWSRYEETGDPDDFDEAVRAFRQAVELTPVASQERARYLNSLGVALSEGCRRSGELTTADHAIEVLREAVEIAPVGAIERVGYLNNLAGALADRLALTGDPVDLKECTAAYRESCRSGITTSLRVTLTAARAWSRWASARAAWLEAAEAAEYGLVAMSQLLRVQLTRAHKEVWLREARYLPTVACFAKAKLNDAEGAVLSLERGIGMLLSEALMRDKADLGRLAYTKNAPLAERYRQARSRVATLQSAEFSSDIVKGLVASDLPEHQERLRESLSELDTVIAEIRQVDGHLDFLAAPEIVDVMRAATNTTLAYVLATGEGGLALTVGNDEFRSVWLPGLKEDELGDRLISYLDAEKGGASWPQALEAMLTWLGATVMGPILKALPDCQHVTLIPVGLLGLVPLHAARLDGGGPQCRYAIEEVAISYAPNAVSLGAARRSSVDEAVDSVLVVDVPQGTGYSLVDSSLEAQIVATLFPQALYLYQDDATKASVIGGLGKYSVVHLACHGVADLLDPLSSALRLGKGESLTLADILARRLDDTRLVVLSACETAMPGVRVPNEAVGFPTGLLQAGAAGVVGSMWRVGDASTRQLMTHFYRLWREEGLDSADALRHAQLALRHHTPTAHPHHWAAFAYFGV
ncbi:MAG: CHAT domain-containing protein, partial [Actinobacteria bacterium]|nr:CHAT domain-containing protein [Actinomycetota bacterium]